MHSHARHHFDGSPMTLGESDAWNFLSTPRATQFDHDEACRPSFGS
jgi:hypothetical protein